jgi:hypothetical protein
LLRAPLIVTRDNVTRFIVRPTATRRFAPFVAIAAAVVLAIVLTPGPPPAGIAELTCVRASNRCVVPPIEYRADELTKIEITDEPPDRDTCGAGPMSLTVHFQSGALQQKQYVGKTCDRAAILRAAEDLNHFRYGQRDEVRVSFPRVQPKAHRTYLIPLALGAVLTAIAAAILRRGAVLTIDRKNDDLHLESRHRGTTETKHLHLNEVKEARVVPGIEGYRVEVLYGSEWEPLEFELDRENAEKLADQICRPTT